MADPIAWPQKMHELHSHHFDSTIWNDFGTECARWIATGEGLG